ncbi:DUF998 domain-containing protein [Nonomuraea sp. NPDC050536]|uniref:DUF998 domain-containing protein n=1 Tax=Nonomuraea sp. NPDC050536 TaxID=3364366 RepID=UPI0037C72D68
MSGTGTNWAAVGGGLVAATALGYAEFALPRQALISDYALVPGGTLPVLVGMLALAFGCVILAYGMAAREPARTAATRLLLLAAGAGLMLSAVFPTDPGGAAISTLPGEIHRWSSAVVFTSLPVAGWMLARGRTPAPRWSWVRSLSMTSALTLAVYLAAHPASFTSPLIGGSAYYGVLERALVLAEIVLLTTMAIATTRSQITAGQATVRLSRDLPPSDEASGGSRDRVAA